MRLSAPAYLEHLEREGTAFGAAARRANPALPIPSCPGWTAADLLAHLGGIHRWTAQMLLQGSAERLSRRDLPPAPAGDEARDWYDEGLQILLSALASQGPDAAVWTFGPPHGQALFWFRRQAHEAQIHRWDMEAASGPTGPLDPDLARDGIEEVLELFVASRPDLAARVPGSLHLHCTDAEGEWTLAPEGERLAVSPGHSRAEAAVRGGTENLLLFLWGRSEPEASFGDASLLARFREAVRP